MTTRTIGRLAAGAALLLSVLAFAGAAHASCGRDQRVSEGDSECLAASWSDGAWSATNWCSHRIKIKIDIRNTSDKTREIEAAEPGNPGRNSGTIRAYWGRRIQNVTCCSDFSSCDNLDDDDDDD